LMMENHSFDNYLGTLGGQSDGFTLDASGEPSNSNPGDGTTVKAHHATELAPPSGVPSQSWYSSHQQWNSGACDGFVRNVEELGRPDARAVPMMYWTEQELPFYHSLARTFPLMDRWFCSCLGPTFPNRRFLMAGTAHGLVDDLPFAMVDYPKGGTIFDLLTAHDISWVNYHHAPRSRVVLSRLLGRLGLGLFRRLGLLLPRLLAQAKKNVVGKLQFTADLYPLGALGSLNHLRSLRQFFRDAANGTLPSFSIVDPDFRRFSEESPQDIQPGEGFAAKVIQAVMTGKGWPNTLLIWVYDEHGGYYDHVPPPVAPAPDDVLGHSLLSWSARWRWIFRRFGFWKKLEQIDRGPTTYDRLGFRVPAVIVSPYARPGYVSHVTHDHTSILKLIERKWNLPALTRRDAAASDPLDALDFQASPAFLEPPTLRPPAVEWSK
jgi:phospholipase C